MPQFEKLKFRFALAMLWKYSISLLNLLIFTNENTQTEYKVVKDKLYNVRRKIKTKTICVISPGLNQSIDIVFVWILNFPAKMAQRMQKQGIHENKNQTKLVN